MAQSMLGCRGYKRSCPSPRGDNCEKVKLYWKYLNMFLFRTWPISTKFDTKHPRVEEIQVCSNDWPNPSQTGHKSEILKSIENIYKSSL